MQEIDLDIEQGATESSFSGDNDIAYQLILSSEYEISKTLSLVADIRWSDTGSISLEGEENALGEINDIDYNPFSFGVSLSHRF